MKAQLVIPENPMPERTYPYIGVTDQGTEEEFQVCFTDKITGVIIKASKYTKYELGHFSDDWFESEFTPLFSLNPQQSPEPPREYPYWGVMDKGTDCQIIIEFSAPQTGMIIQNNMGVPNQLGCISKGWNEHNFSPLPKSATIILSQE